MVLNKKKTLVFVLGMHRSGTSALAGSLALLGLGTDQDLWEANPEDNPKGYWEPKDVVAINEAIFSALCMHHMDAWALPGNWLQSSAMSEIRERIDKWLQKVYLSEVQVVVKDPRLCRTLPVWLEVVKQYDISCKFIHIYRNPREVIASLQVRDTNYPDIDAELAWISYNLSAALIVKDFPHLLTNYHSLLDRPAHVLQTISTELVLGLSCSKEQDSNKVNSFLEPSLAHHKAVEDPEAWKVTKLAKELYGVFLEYDGRKSDSRFCQIITSLSKEFEEILRIAKYGNVQLQMELSRERENCKEQVAYRDLLTADLQRALDAERCNAFAQTEFRDRMIADLSKQLSDEKANAIAQIEYRDALVADLGKQLSDEKINAVAQIEYREALVAELNLQLENERDLAVKERQRNSEFINQLQAKLDAARELLRSRAKLFKMLVQGARDI